MVAGLVAIAFVFTRTSVFYVTQGYAVPIRPSFVRPEWGGTADKLTARLTLLMETGAPYRDPDLSLAKLAKMLEVDPKRLSYHLHANLSTSFRSYVNERRLEAVCRALLDCADRSILETAFANGFNSKSSFNTLFVRKYGMTPKEYKKKNCAEHKDSHQ
jgi:AraC-like DNA-binding protein